MTETTTFSLQYRAPVTLYYIYKVDIELVLCYNTAFFKLEALVR